MTEIDTDKLRALDAAATGEAGPFHVSRTSDGKAHWFSALDSASGVSIPAKDRDDAYALVSSLNEAASAYARRERLVSEDAILAMAEERVRSENHRNDLADKITEQSVEIGALKAEVERLSRICASNAATMEEQAIRFRRLGKSTSELDAAVSETRRALGKDKA